MPRTTIPAAEYARLTLHNIEGQGRSVLVLLLDIRGRLLPAVIDTGATSTFIGAEGMLFAARLGFVRRSTPDRPCTVGNGQEVLCQEEVEFEASLRGRQRVITARVLPNLPVPLLLGLDSLEAMGICIDVLRRVWFFSGEAQAEYRFERVEGPESLDLAMPIVDLSDEEGGRLEKFLANEIPRLQRAPGLTNLVQHRIDVGDATPIKQRWYPFTPIVRDAMNAEVDRMLDARVIERSRSEWSSPIVMVKKPNGTYRFCIDFRKVNAVSKKDAYPLPYMSHILDCLRSARYISTLDLSQAFHQIPLAEGSREITAFTAPHRGLFHFTRMPYGLTTAPATFQRLLDQVISPDMQPAVFAYLDDIVIATETFDEHLMWLRRVFDRILVAGLLINPEKCEFCRSELRYLGFLINNSGLQPDPEKVAPIREYPAPSNVHEVRRFLGATSWYRRFIPGYASIAEPITRLTKKAQIWTWGDEQQDAFERLRQCLMEAPVLARPDFSKKFTLQTDASLTGLGAVLTQEPEGAEHPIAYASRALASAERNYDVRELECLAILWSVEKFKPYLNGYRFTVITDHESLKWLFTQKEPKGRIARWIWTLTHYDFDIIHRR